MEPRIRQSQSVKSGMAVRETRPILFLATFGVICLAVGICIGRYLPMQIRDSDKNGNPVRKFSESTGNELGGTHSARTLELEMGRLEKSFSTEKQGDFQWIGDVSRFASGIERGDFEAAIELAGKVKRSDCRIPLEHAIYEQWTTVEPGAAADHANQLFWNKRKWMLGDILSLWAKRDHEAALRWIETGMPEGLDGNMKSRILTAIASVAPAAAFDLQLRSPILSGSNLATDKSSLVQAWARNDPAAAAEYASVISDANDRRDSIKRVAQLWVEIDPEKTWNWALALEDPEDRIAAQESLLTAMGELDPDAAFQKFRVLVDENERNSIGLSLMRSIAANYPGKAYNFTQTSFEEPHRSHILKSVIGEWAKSDPETAYRIAFEDLPLGEARVDAMSRSLKELVEKDLDLTLELLGEIESVGTLDALMSDLSNKLVYRDLEKSKIFADSLPEGKVKADLQDRIAVALAKSEPEAAADYILKVDGTRGGSYRRMKRVLDVWARNAPADAIRWSIQNLDDRAIEESLPGLARFWAQHDIEAAVEWSQKLPSDGLRSEVVAELVAHLAHSDISAAAEFLDGMPKDLNRDEAIYRFSQTASEHDPVSAIAWSEEIEDEAIRTTSIDRIAHLWHTREPAAAKAWLRDNQMPEERTRRILNSDAVMLPPPVFK